VDDLSGPARFVLADGCDDSLATRLRSLCRGLEAVRRAGPTGEGEMAEAATLERMLREGRLDEALALCRALTASRNPARMLRLYGQVVLPVIRRLESHWLDDRIDFAELSMTFFHLHRLLSALSDTHGSEPATNRPDGVLVATAPGEDHVFGAQILADLLRTSGRGVTLLFRTTPELLLAQVAERHHAAVCL
jgi:hypothetical protein